jgi:micrococcal nuclease
VRLANVDAPEMSHGHGKPGQPYSVQSMRWLANQLEGQAGITVVCPDQDRYGRKVCDFYKGGRHVNKELVRVGLAWANTANPRYLRDRTVLDAQAQAQAARSGLWAEGKPVEPWNWRHECWGRGACGAH